MFFVVSAVQLSKSTITVPAPANAAGRQYDRRSCEQALRGRADLYGPGPRGAEWDESETALEGPPQMPPLYCRPRREVGD